MMLLKWTAGAAAMTFVMAGPGSAGPVLTGVAQVPAPKWGLAAPVQREQAVPAQYKPPAKIAQDKAKARRKQMEKLRKQMQAQKKKTATLSKNMLTLRGALRKARVKLAETGLGPDDPGLDADTKEAIKTVRKMGGEFYSAQLGIAPEGSVPANRQEADKLARKRAQDARKELDRAVAELDEIRSMPEATRNLKQNKVRAKLARKRLRDFGGPLEEQAYDAAVELEDAARSVGLNTASPFLDRMVPFAEGEFPRGELIDQGSEMICGYVSAQMASCKGGKALKMSDLEKFVAVDRDANNVAIGKSADEIAKMLKGNSIDTQVHALDAGAGGVDHLARLLGPANAGPIIISVAARSANAPLAQVATPTFAQTYAPEGASPAMTRMALQAKAANAYRHWVVIDGVYNVDVNGKPEPHFAVRDPDGGKAFYFSKADLNAIFDGNAVELK